MCVSIGSRLLLLPIATLAFALGAPTTAPAQNPCAGGGDVPSAQCKEWMKQQKLNATCAQNPQKPECKDWLKKQQSGPSDKRKQQTKKSLGGPDMKGKGSWKRYHEVDEKSKKTKGGSKSVPAVQKKAK